jgi:hypothetical protein
MQHFKKNIVPAKARMEADVPNEPSYDNSFWGRQLL